MPGTPSTFARSTARRHAFTLVELLVVMAIIMVLLSMTLSVTRAVRESARRAVCAERLKQMAMATIAYGTDNQGLLPHGGPWNNPSKGAWSTTGSPAYLAMVGYLEKDLSDPTWRKRFFMCPSSDPKKAPAWSSEINYSFYTGTPFDYPLTLSRTLAIALNCMPQIANRQIALFADNTWINFPGNGSGGFTTNCNHKRMARLIWGNQDEGEPAGANVAQSDGAVVWANYGGMGPYTPELTYGRPTMVVNGGSIGGWQAIPNNMLWFRLNNVGDLDMTRTFLDNMSINWGYNTNLLTKL